MIDQFLPFLDLQLSSSLGSTLEYLITVSPFHKAGKEGQFNVELMAFSINLNAQHGMIHFD